MNNNGNGKSVTRAIPRDVERVWASMCGLVSRRRAYERFPPEFPRWFADMLLDLAITLVELLQHRYAMAGDESFTDAPWRNAKQYQQVIDRFVQHLNNFDVTEELDFDQEIERLCGSDGEE